MIDQRSERKSPGVWFRRAGGVIGVCEPVEELESRVCLAYAIADWCPLNGGNEWHQTGEIDQMPADGVTRSTAGVVVGQQTTTRLATQLRMFNGMYSLNDERYLKLAPSGLKLLQENRWGDFGSQAIRYWNGGATLMSPTVNVGDEFAYSVRVTAQTDRGAISGTAAGTVRIVGIETVKPFTMHEFRFNALKVVRSEVITGSGSGWTTEIDVNETLWFAKGIGLVNWSYEQRDQTSLGTDQTSRVAMGVVGGNQIISDSIGLRVDGRSESIRNHDSTVSFEEGTNFGVIDVHNQYGVSTFTVLNTSPHPMSINRVSLAGHDTSDFKITRSPVGELMPGEARTLKVRFNPIAPGIRTARVVIESSDPLANPYNFKIQGEGVLLGTINVQQIDRSTPIVAGAPAPTWATGTLFGNVTANGSYVDRTFMITNSGPGDLNLGKIFVTFPGNMEIAPPFFIFAGPSSTTLSPQSSTTFTLRFRPLSVGVINAKISISSNDRHTPMFEYMVKGTGV